MGMTSWTTGQCVFCGDEGIVTDDHVPAKCLFPDPKPPNLITVPGCGACNGGASNDDEYFKRMLVLRSDLHEHPAASRLRPAVLRSLRNPNQRRFRAAFLRTVKQADVRTPAGLYLGQVPMYHMEMDRMHRVAGRIIRGLYYHVTKERLPPNAEALPVFEPQNVTAVGGVWLGRLLSLPETVIGEGVFSYRFKFFPDRQWASVWLLLFYDTVAIIGATKAPGFGAPDLEGLAS